MFSYLAARIGSGVASVLTIKFLIDFVAKTDYGRWSVLSATSDMLVPVLTLSLPAAMMRLYFDLDEHDREGQARLITTTFQLTVAGGLTLIAISMALAAIGALSGAAVLYLTAATTGVMTARFFNYLTRLRDDRRMYFFNEVADRVVFIALLALAVTHRGEWLLKPFGSDRLLAAIAFFSAARWLANAVAIAYYAARRLLVATVRQLPWEQVLEMVRFSAPLSAVFFLGWALSASDLLLLQRLSTADQVADYAFAVGIASVVALVTQAALTDWPRFYYREMRDGHPDRDDRIARHARTALWLHVLAIVLLRASAPVVYRLYGAEAFLTGLPYIQYLVVGNFFFLAGNLFGSGISYVKKTYLSVVTFGVAGLANILLNLLLIPRFGAMAAAVTTLLSYVLFAGANWWIGRRHYALAYPWWYVAAATTAVIVGLLPMPAALSV